jgi:flagellar hook-basal body complex protein FliE
MIDPQINSICKLVHEWCHQNDMQFDIVCDESDIQGVMIFKKDTGKLNNLLDHIQPAVSNSEVHVETTQVRGGVVITFSLSALSEQSINTICSNYGREVIPMTFIDKINKAFDINHTKSIEEQSAESMNPVDSIEATDEQLEEGQYKTATSGMVRGQRRDEYLTYNQSTKGASKGASKGSKPRREVSGPKAASHESFDDVLRSALLEQEDVAPETLFKQFARALRVLGNKMGIGPIQDKLKEQGINWKQSSDGRDIILTIRNATTQTDQPIARITYETLTNPADFENQLKSMLDFAMGDAPGASAQQEREIADRKKTVSDIAKAVQPTDQESEVAQQMNAGIQPEMQAAETAAMPK